MKTNKTYTFAVPCSYVYEIEAETQEKAKEILMEKGGWDISGELCLESEDYKNATCLDEYDSDSPTPEECIYLRKKLNDATDVMQMASDYMNEDDYTVCEKADVENALNSFLNKEKQQ